jgi:hypothetical protein
MARRRKNKGTGGALSRPSPRSNNGALSRTTRRSSGGAFSKERKVTSNGALSRETRRLDRTYSGPIHRKTPKRKKSEETGLRSLFRRSKPTRQDRQDRRKEKAEQRKQAQRETREERKARIEQEKKDRAVDKWYDDNPGRSRYDD